MGGDVTLQLSGQVVAGEVEHPLFGLFRRERPMGLGKSLGELGLELLELLLGGGELFLQRLDIGLAQRGFVVAVFVAFLVAGLGLGGLDLPFQLRLAAFHLFQLLQVVAQQTQDQLVVQRVESGGLFPVVAIQRVEDGVHPAFHQSLEALGGEGAQVVLAVVPPAGDDAGDLVAVEQADRHEGRLEAVQQLGAQGHEVAALGQLAQVLFVGLPPGGEGIA